MKKSSVSVLAVILVAVLAASLFIVGCGGGSSAEKEGDKGAAGILKSSQAKMENVKSVKLKGVAKVDTPGAEEKTETVEFEIAVSQPSKDDVQMHMVQHDSDGQATEMYVMDGYAYTNDPTTGWSKTPYEGSGALSSGVVTPGSISDMTKYAKNLKIADDKEGRHSISFAIGSDFIDELFEQAAAAQSAPSAEQDEATQQLVQTMKDMLKGIQMNMIYKVDKKTLLGDEVQVKMSMKNAPALGDISVVMSAKMYDYGVPVTIALPPEAQNAPEQPVGPGGIPSIPSIPGLGM